MRPARAQSESSPAVLRLLASLQPGGDGVQLEIIKRKGPPAAHALQLPARAARLAALLACSAAGVCQFANLFAPASDQDLQSASVSTLIPRAGDALDRVAAVA